MFSVSVRTFIIVESACCNLYGFFSDIWPVTAIRPLLSQTTTVRKNTTPLLFIENLLELFVVGLTLFHGIVAKRVSLFQSAHTF